MIRCLVIDDEPLAQNVLETYIKKVHFLTLVAKCENAVDAFDVLQNENIDLIFSDIHMPEVNGIEFIKSLKNSPFVIFTTAFSEYALEGFNVDAVDYLMKPVAFDRFLKSVNKVKQLTSSGQSAKSEALSYLFVKEDYKLVKVNFHEIFYIEGMKDYVKIFTTAKMTITHITMKRLEELLPKEKFLRTHKSFIVSLDAIKAVNGNTIEMANNSKIPIGLQYREIVMKALNNIG
jgi:two-component system LytT family response regulator